MRISDWSSDVCSSDLIVAGDPIRSQSESDERACDDNGTQSSQSDATQCPVSRHQSMQSSKPLIRLLALWLGRRSFPTQSARGRSEEHTTELQSLMLISYAVFCLKQQHNLFSINLKIH